MSMTQTMNRLIFGREVSSGIHSIPWASPVVIGRVFLSAIFIFSGIAKFLDWSGNLAYMESQTGIEGMSWLLAVAGIVEIVGGLSILTGTVARLGALALVAYLAVVTYLFHDFWNLAGSARDLQMTMFLKNLSIIGGLMLVLGFGAGRASVDQKIGANEGG